MDILGIGPLELILILIIGLLVLGPERLPEVARQVTKLTKQMRRITGEFSKEFSTFASDVMEETNGQDKQAAEPGQNAETGASTTPIANSEPSVTSEPDSAVPSQVALATQTTQDIENHTEVASSSPSAERTDDSSEAEVEKLAETALVNTQSSDAGAASSTDVIPQDAQVADNVVPEPASTIALPKEEAVLAASEQDTAEKLDTTE
jgi:Tat protein translocase TatB subunit